MTTSPTTAATGNSSLQNYLNTQAQNIAADKTSAANAAASSTSTSATTLGTNLNTFLNILTQQLKHQDPTNATDPNQFTQELVQFAGVEQQLNANKKLDTLISLQQGNGSVSAALGYVNQYVEAKTTAGKVPLQDSKAEIGYTLPSDASTVKITIKDAKGNTVNTLDGVKTKGLDYISWNGKDSTGTQLADGAYSFTIAATDANGNAIATTDQRIVGKVTGVTSNSDSTTNLSLGDVSIGTSTVNSIYSAGNTPKATAA